MEACIAAGVNITYKILYNGHVSMTGGQDVIGATAIPDLTRKLQAEGVGAHCCVLKSRRNTLAQSLLSTLRSGSHELPRT